MAARAGLVNALYIDFKMATVCCRSVFFFLLILGTGCYDQRFDVSEFSRAILSMTNDTLGVGRMQEYFANMSYTKAKTSISAEQVAAKISPLFRVQQDALQRIKIRVEQLYALGLSTPRAAITECCNVVNLTEDYIFGLPISEQHSCDRVSAIAEPSAPSLFSLLDDTFEDNKKIPLKWQYFGSEKGILNQFPSSKPSDCSSYDNRFRPWYKASATPNPKDVVIVIKNNPFDHTRRLFEAADIILRTLNPRDRVAMVIYNDEIARNVIGGCYATNLSLATPANVNLFQYFLKTAPDPKSGNRMSLALETAYKYYDHDIDLDGILINGTHVNASHPNITRRDRAIVFLTDGHRLTDGEKEKTMEVLKTYCDRLTMVSIFVLVTHSNDVSLGQEMMYFLSVVVASVYQGTEENLIQLDPKGDLRQSITQFYAKFASQAQHSSVFKPVFMVPYYDVFGLEQLVMTLSTPCYRVHITGEIELLGVASVDLTVSDMFASAELFTQGDLSYAFVIDQDGLVLYHPLLPFPSSTSAAVYLDISTLEPQPGFSEIRESMMSGGSGSMQLESQPVLSRGRSKHHESHSFSITSIYSWAPIQDTPFSLCVVIPKGAYDCEYAEDMFTPPIKAHYHTLDILADKSDLCRQVAQYATPNYSTVVLFPEAFEQYSSKYGEELKREAVLIQNALTTLPDDFSKLKPGVLKSVAATAKAEEVWLELDSEHDNSSHGDNIHDYVAWRYIASSFGMMRIYPGTEVDIKGRRANRYPWYQSAVSDVDSVSISPPYIDHLGTGHTIALSKAIVRTCVPELGEDAAKGIQCGIEAVMAMDIAHGHFWTLLTQAVEICRQPQRYRCMVIDSNAYVITHPRFFEGPENIESQHLSALEPFLMHDMYHVGYVERVYCNNFQYNYQFTKRPRKQYSYEVTDKVKTADTPLEGGYITRCVFYKISPVAGTNTFVIAVDVQRSSKPLCTPVSCPCDPDQPCSNLPNDCTCPCVEEIPPEKYNSCFETFTGLCAPACSVKTGFLNQSNSLPKFSANSDVRACYPHNCSEKSTPVDCLSSISCKLYPTTLDNGSTIFQCRELGYIPEPSMLPNITTSVDSILMWHILSGVLLGVLVLLVLSFMVYYVREKSWKSHGKVRVDMASSNMVSIVTDSSVENSLKRQDSQEQDDSSQEGLPVSVRKPSNPTASLVTFRTIFTVADSGIAAEGREGRGVGVVGVEGAVDGVKEAEYEGDDVFPDHPNDKKTCSSFPDSLGTNGVHDMLSKLGESPDPSKAGGIWF